VSGASGRVLSEADVKVDVRREPGSKAVLEVEIPVETVTSGFDRALRKLNGRVVVPGFRKGKAPRTMLERHVGRDAIIEEAVNHLVPDAYTKALDQTGVQPIARPQIQVDTLEEGKPLRFTATVDLVPEVRLGPLTQSRLPMRRDVRAVERTEGRIERASAGERHGTRPGVRVAANAAGSFGHILTVLNVSLRESCGETGEEGPGKRQPENTTNQPKHAPQRFS